MKTEEQQFRQEEYESHRQYQAAQTHAFMEAWLPVMKVQLEQVAELLHDWNYTQGFWNSENVGEKLMLITSEIAEAMEADRKDIQRSEHIPAFTGVEEELADAVIRILDFAHHFKLRLPEAIVAKTHFNLSRPYMHGKKN